MVAPSPPLAAVLVAAEAVSEAHDVDDEYNAEVVELERALEDELIVELANVVEARFDERAADRYVAEPVLEAEPLAVDGEIETDEVSVAAVQVSAICSAALLAWIDSQVEFEVELRDEKDEASGRGTDDTRVNESWSGVVVSAEGGSDESLGRVAGSVEKTVDSAEEAAVMTAALELSAALASVSRSLTSGSAVETTVCVERSAPVPSKT